MEGIDTVAACNTFVLSTISNQLLTTVVEPLVVVLMELGTNVVQILRLVVYGIIDKNAERGEPNP